jgi:hypothetical protein
VHIFQDMYKREGPKNDMKYLNFVKHGVVVCVTWKCMLTYAPQKSPLCVMDSERQASNFMSCICKHYSRSRSLSYMTTDDQLASLSWYHAHKLGPATSFSSLFNYL